MFAVVSQAICARGGIGPYCAKLHHTNDRRCIFRHTTPQRRSAGVAGGD